MVEMWAMSDEGNGQAAGSGNSWGAKTRFPKGKSPNPGGKPRVDEAPILEVPGWEHADDLLRDVRWAYRNLGRRCPVTPAQAELRKLFEENREKFLDLKVKLEAAYREEYPVERAPSEPTGGAVVEEEVDEGTARCLELAERVLGEILADIKAAEGGDG